MDDVEYEYGVWSSGRGEVVLGPTTRLKAEAFREFHYEYNPTFGRADLLLIRRVIRRAVGEWTVAPGREVAEDGS